MKTEELIARVRAIVEEGGNGPLRQITDIEAIALTLCSRLESHREAMRRAIMELDDGWFGDARYGLQVELDK